MLITTASSDEAAEKTVFLLVHPTHYMPIDKLLNINTEIYSNGLVCDLDLRAGVMKRLCDMLSNSGKNVYQVL